jgi:GT2 family glycosyltransferase
MAVSLAQRAPAGALDSQRPDPLRPITADVVICAYTARRWDALVEAVASVRRQTRAPSQTIVVVDHNPELLARARAQLEGVKVVPNAGSRGLSGARNTGVRTAESEVVAFLDDDATASPQWLDTLLRGYRDESVIGTGGVVTPRWAEGAGRDWLPPEFYWTIGCSYRGLPERLAAVRNPIGANMSFRRDVIVDAGGFREGVGRLDTTPLGCEETELSVRAACVRPGATILHVPEARVHHLVQADRANWRYFRSRCWSEGISKAAVAGHVGTGSGLASERDYVLRALPRGILRGVADAALGHADGLRRAGAILAGLAFTSAGYLYGRLRRSSGAALEAIG